MNAQVKKVPTYCYQCVNGPDLLTVEVVDGVATKVEPNFNADGVHPASGNYRTSRAHHPLLFLSL